MFDTVRSPMGEQVYLLKNKNNLNAAKEIIELIEKDYYCVSYLSKCDFIVPIPPTKKGRAYQPVEVVAKMLGQMLDKTIMYILDSAPHEEIKKPLFRTKSTGYGRCAATK